MDVEKFLNMIKDKYYNELNLSEKEWVDDMLCLTSWTFEQVIEVWRIRNKLDL